MNRPIKFRGKRVDNGEWVYGYYVESKARHEGWDETGYWFLIYIDIADFGDIEYYKVIPETVGQYTGLKDKNNNEIYEGDIFKWATFNGEVVFKDGCFVFDTIDNYSMTMRDHKSTELEVIGNIHENKNILQNG